MSADPEMSKTLRAALEQARRVATRYKARAEESEKYSARQGDDEEGAHWAAFYRADAVRCRKLYERAVSRAEALLAKARRIAERNRRLRVGRVYTLHESQLLTLVHRAYLEGLQAYASSEDEGVWLKSKALPLIRNELHNRETRESRAERKEVGHELRC